MPLYSQAEKEAKRLQQMSVSVANEQPGISNMLEGQQQLSVIGGVVTDVKKVNDDLYHNRLFRSFEEQVDTILNEESVIKVQHKFTGNPVFDPGFQSDTFSSGFTGNGMKLNKDSVNEYNFELDNMIIRGRMSVYELLIQQIRASNGGIFVTSSAKVDSSTSLSASDDDGDIVFDDPSETGGTGLCPFLAGDIIMMQRVNPGVSVAKNVAGTVTGGMVKKLVYKVSSVSGKTATVTTAGFDNLSYPVKGDEFVRIGNVGTGAGGTANRDGVMYLTSDDTNAPFMEIFSGITSYGAGGAAAWTSAVPKVRLGNLSGITYDGVSLNGEYGLYSENVYLTGKIIATSGSFTGSLSVGANDNIFRVNTDGDMWIGDADQGDAPFQVDNQGVVIAKKITLSSPISSGGTYFNLEQAGDAYFSSNRVKFTKNGSISLVGNASGTAGIVFYAGTDTPSTGSHTGDSWSVFQDSVGNLGTMFNDESAGSGTVSMYWKVNGNIQMASQKYFWLGKGDDAGTGFRRNVGHLEIYSGSGDPDSKTMGLELKNPASDGSGGYNPGLFHVKSLGSGDVQSSSTGLLSVTSSREYKENISTIPNSLDKVMLLDGVYYDWKTDLQEDMGSEKQMGFIAEDVKSIIPEATGVDMKGNASMYYGRVTALLVNAIKELKAEVEELKNSS